MFGQTSFQAEFSSIAKQFFYSEQLLSNQLPHREQQETYQAVACLDTGVWV
jgi:hypothetical protein